MLSKKYVVITLRLINMLRCAHCQLSGLAMHPSQHIHFVGAGGIGMSGLVRILLQQGFTVSGSDQGQNTQTQMLQNLGAVIHQGHDARHIDHADILIVSTAIDQDNPELLAAKAKNLPIMHRGKLLAELAHQKPQTIAITGAHGKTTTTSLVTSIFRKANLGPSFAIGGNLGELGVNAQHGKGDVFIAEADESDASFLQLHPSIAILANIDAEHMDTYQHSLEVLYQANLDFINRVAERPNGLAIINRDDQHIQKLLPNITAPYMTFGQSENADVQIKNFKQTRLSSQFVLQSSKLGLSDQLFELNMPGIHNVYNATSAIIAALHAGIDVTEIQFALKNFKGVGRRLQPYGNININGHNVLLFDDYSHHPCEINAMLKAVTDAYPNRQIIHVSQLHRYTRTRDLLDEFAQSLAGKTDLILLPIYPASEKPILNIDTEHMMDKIKQLGKHNVWLAADFDAAKQKIELLVEKNAVIVTQGAGNIGRFIPDVLIPSCCPSVSNQVRQRL